MISRYIPKRYLFEFIKKENLQGTVILDKKKPIDDFGSIDENSKLKHYPVNHEIVSKIIRDQLIGNDKSSKVMLDCTIGTAGHAKLLLKEFQNLHILGLDLDSRMIDMINKTARPELDQTENKRFELERLNFAEIDRLNTEKYFEGKFKEYLGFDCIFADLGYNSVQLEGKEWGLSYNLDVPLDMRYDHNMRENAADILNNAPFLQLKSIISEYGEEPSSDSVAKAIIKERGVKKFENSRDVRDLIFDKFDIPNARKYKILMRVFQALRIAVNSEFSNLERLLDKIEPKLNPNGIAIIITFHSIEHNMVYRKMGDLKKYKKIDVIEKGLPSSKEELSQNSRSRSSKLYCFRKKSVS